MRICEGEKVHSKVHSMRVCFVRPRNFPAMSIFSRHVKIFFVRPPDFVRVAKEQIIFVYNK